MASKGLVVFKYEDEEDDGTPVGPVWIHHGPDPANPEQVETLDEWVRLPEAQRLAQERGFDFLKD